MFENESWAGDVVYLDNPEDIWAYDTTEPGDGAPGKPGEIRWCYAELNSGVKVLQKRRLTRLALLLGASVVKGSYLELGTGSYFVADALAPANMPLTDAAGFVSEEVNREGKGSVAQGVLPTGYWFWAVVEGPCDVITDAAVAVDTPMIPKAATGAGRLDDTAPAGLEHTICGRFLEAGGAPATSVEALVKLGF